MRRDTGEAYQAYLTRLAAASGIKTPTREVLARFDRKRKKNTSNSERVAGWVPVDSERGIAWRAADSLSCAKEAAPDHSTMSRTRRVIDVETHRAVFTCQQRLAAAGRLKGRTIANANDAEYRAPGHGGSLPGVSDPPRRSLGDQDADARSLGSV